MDAKIRVSDRKIVDFINKASVAITRREATRFVVNARKILSAQHGPSPPGNPPGYQSMTLANAVDYQINSNQSSRGQTIGSIVVYRRGRHGIWLEHGTARVRARPWIGAVIKATWGK